MLPSPHLNPSERGGARESLIEIGVICKKETWEFVFQTGHLLRQWTHFLANQNRKEMNWREMAGQREDIAMKSQQFSVWQDKAM